MARVIHPQHHLSLADYAEVAHLSPAVHELRAVADQLAPELRGRTVWMINSTAEGGGVAEMLPTLVSLLGELGVKIEWAVIGADDPAFFTLTKRIHNLIHGEGDPLLTEKDRALYERVSRANADAMRRWIGADDVLAVHDPQPLGTGHLLQQETGARALWRCHIGLDLRTPETGAAWNFLRSYTEGYRHTAFSAPEYIPGYLAGNASVIHPAIDPLSHKNRSLSIHKLVGILVDSSLMRAAGPVLAPPWPEPALRLQPGGSYKPATEPEDIGLLFHPVVTQISRWDRLKGWTPLLEGFARLKTDRSRGNGRSERHGWMVEKARLVLAGPDPASVQDDPESREVLAELERAYAGLSPELQRDVVLLTLPMGSRKYNALMVNALQRCSTVVAQNSLQEGFGLTVTEAMWKHVAVMGTRACGIRQQIREGVEGRLVEDAEDAGQVAGVLDELLADQYARRDLGRTAQHRVHQEFLIFNQLRRWLEMLAELVR